MNNKTTVALIGGIISTLYFMTLFVPQCFWFYHWVLRIGGLSGFFLLGTLGKTEKTPMWATTIIGGHYGIIFATEFVGGYISFLHAGIPETAKYYLMSYPIGLFVWGALFASLWFGAYYSNKWGLYDE